MPTRKVVADASPFILLSKAGLIHLLPELFEEVLLPDGVWEEIDKVEDAAGATLANQANRWIRVQVPVSDEVLIWNLGTGESEVLSLALVNRETHLALIDDRAARRCAEALGIATLGTSGVLILAKRRGLIASVRTELEKLIGSGLWIASDLVNTILIEADEQ